MSTIIPFHACIVYRAKIIKALIDEKSTLCFDEFLLAKTAAVAVQHIFRIMDKDNLHINGKVFEPQTFQRELLRRVLEYDTRLKIVARFDRWI